MKHKFTHRLNAFLLTLALSLSLVSPAWAATSTPDPDPDPLNLKATLAATEGFNTVDDSGSGGTIRLKEAQGTLQATIERPVTSITKVSYQYIWNTNNSNVVTVLGRTSDESEADTVTANASVTTVGVGTAMISVDIMASWTEIDEVSDTSTQKTAIANMKFEVKVLPIPVNALALEGRGLTNNQDGPKVTMKAGTNLEITANVVPSNSTYQDVEWKIKDGSAQDVIELGKVSGKRITINALKEGETIITATTNVGDDADDKPLDPITIDCAITVTPADILVTGVKLDKDKLDIKAQAKDPATLTATVAPDDATNQTVRWRSSDPNVATVSGGKVKGITPGTATITVTTEDGGFEATCEVTVTAAESTGVTISSGTYTAQNPLYLDIGDKPVKLVAVVAPQGANQAVTWASENDKIAKVDSEGNVTAVGVGKTKITATSVADKTKVSEPCPVEVSGVTLTGQLETMSINQSQPLKLDRTGNARDNLKKSWTSSNPGVASVDEKDNLVARALGTATITLKCTNSNGREYPVEPDTFTVKVVEDSKTVYTGEATAGAPYEFETIMGELDRICRSINSNGLSYVTNLTVPTSEGVLYYNHVSTDDTGFGVGSTERYYYKEGTVGERYLGGVTFVPNSEFNGETTITYTGYDSKGARYLGKVRLNVTGSGNVTYITKSGDALVLSSTGFSAASRSETGREISSVTFTLPDESKGTLYYGASTSGEYRYKVTAGEKYYRTRTPYLDQVRFVPAEYYIGTLSLPFAGEDTAGNTFSGKLYIIVVPDRPDGERSELTTTALRGTTVDFDKFNFSTACTAITGHSLSYIRFTPPSSTTGTIYYKYTSSSTYDSIVNANTRYYPSQSPRLNDLTFVPNGDRIQPVTIDFVGYTTAGTSFNGAVTIYYRDAGSGDDVITYAVTSGQAIPFEPADFDDLCTDITGKSLSRIQFQQLPTSSQGTLFRNYTSGSSTGTRVTTKDTIYRSSLSTVAFAPKSDFIGTVELEFVGYTSDNTRFTGTVRIDVEEGNTALRYTVRSGGSVRFNASDFNEICTQATDGKLDYVRFQLPPSNRGTLYCRTGNSTTGRNPVNANTSYYYTSNGSNRIGNVTFTAASGYTGTVNIDFTGFSTSGARFTGTVEIAVATQNGTTLHFTTTSEPYTIPGDEVVSACASLLSRNVSYIRFNSLPGSDEGKLYYDYVGYNTGTLATTATKYYQNQDPYLDRLVFVPRESFTGTVSLPYTAYDSRGGTVSGNINLEVTAATSSNAFVDMERHTWAISSVDFLYANGVVGGVGNSQYAPASNFKRGDYMLVLDRVYNFRSAGTNSFNDVPQNSYYAEAIASAKAEEVVPSDGLFRPESPITRQDAMLYLYNAMKASGQNVPAGSESELHSFTDYNSVSEEARGAVTSMIHMGIIQGDNYRRINPTSSITRAEMAVLIHRAMTQ